MTTFKIAGYGDEVFDERDMRQRTEAETDAYVRDCVASVTNEVEINLGHFKVDELAKLSEICGTEIERRKATPQKI
jgi:hypothetical protein